MYLATSVEMPVNPSPTAASVAFTLAAVVTVVALLVWWVVSGEYKRGPVLPLLFLGTSISAIAVEPVFDKTLLYWYPPDNALGVFAAFGRTVPWFVPIGYAWFFGGSAYVLWRLFERGVSRAQI
jgi:hypothetical protein